MCGGVHHRSFYMSAVSTNSRNPVRLNTYPCNMDRHSSSSEMDNATTTTTIGIAKSTEANGCSANDGANMTHSTPNITLKPSELLNQVRSVSSCSSYPDRKCVNVFEQYNNVDEELLGKRDADGKPTESTDNVTTAPNQQLAKHNTEAVLKNGHQKWPSVRLESRC